MHGGDDYSDSRPGEYFAGVAGGAGDGGADEYGTAKRALGVEIRRLRGDLPQDRLAERINVRQGTLSKAERGKELLPEPAVAELDQVFEAGGRLVEMDQLARALKHTQRDGRLPAMPRRTTEASPTDRRQLFQVGGLAAAGVTTGSAAAAELARRMAVADPDPITLDQLEGGAYRLAGIYTSTPYHVLEPQVRTAWETAENLLDTRISDPVRKRVRLVAGQYSFFLAHLRFDQGDPDGAYDYLRLAGRHAAQAAEPVLVGSIAGLRSSLAYWGNAYSNAADVAASVAETHPHPYTRGMLAAMEARAAIADGQRDRGIAALGTMKDHIWDGGLIPGRMPVYEWYAHEWLAGSLGRLGRGEEAELHARTSLSLLTTPGTVQIQPVASAYNVLSRSLLRRAEPDPEQAAATAGDALEAIAARPHFATIQSSTTLWREMEARWSTLPAVRDLGEQVHSARLALPAGKTV